MCQFMFVKSHTVSSGGGRRRRREVEETKGSLISYSYQEKEKERRQEKGIRRRGSDHK